MSETGEHPTPKHIPPNKALLRGAGRKNRERPMSPEEIAKAGGDRTDQVVYFLRVGGMFEIGQTDDIGDFLAWHRKHIFVVGTTYAVLALVSGGPEAAESVQRFFAPWRIEAKEPRHYQLTVELAEYIRWLRDFREVEVGEDFRANEFPADLLRLDFNDWAPRMDRRKPSPQPLFPFLFSPRIRTADDWYTDAGVLAVARSAIGGTFDLDPASHAIANATVQAKRFFSKHDDGLKQPWNADRVWLNPPFSDYGKFAAKLIEEFRTERAKQIILLASAPGLSTEYMRDVFRFASTLFVLSGRIPFVGDMTQFASNATPFGYGLVYLGSRVEEVEYVFHLSNLGTVFRIHHKAVK